MGENKERKSGLEVLIFMCVGAVATAAHYGVYYLLLSLGLNYNIAYTAGFTMWLLFNFFGGTYITFKTKPTVAKAFKFLISNVINYFIQMGILNIVLLLSVSKEFAPIFVYTLAFPINFLLVRYSIKGKRVSECEA